MIRRTSRGAFRGPPLKHLRDSKVMRKFRFVTISLHDVIPTLLYLRRSRIPFRIRPKWGRDLYPTNWATILVFDFPLSELFARHYSHGTLPLTDMPHVAFSEAEKKGFRDSSYISYLKAGQRPAPNRPPEEQISHFSDLIKSISHDPSDVFIQTKFDPRQGKIIILDGVHRAAASYTIDPDSSITCLVPLIWVQKDRRRAQTEG